MALRLLVAMGAIAMAALVRLPTQIAGPCRGPTRLPQLALSPGTHLPAVGCIVPHRASWRDWAQVAELPERVARRLQARCQAPQPVGAQGRLPCSVGSDLSDFRSVRGVGERTLARIVPLLCRWPP